MFNRNGASFAESGKVQLEMLYVSCPKERKYVARPSPLVGLLKGLSGLSNQEDLCTALNLPTMVSLSLRISVVGDAIATSNLECKQRDVPCSQITITLICLRFPYLVVVFFVRRLRNVGQAMSAVASLLSCCLRSWSVSLITSLP